MLFLRNEGWPCFRVLENKCETRLRRSFLIANSDDRHLQGWALWPLSVPVPGLGHMLLHINPFPFLTMKIFCLLALIYCFCVLLIHILDQF
jgi:hypothetical protein